MRRAPIHFADGGTGQALVLLHAFPLDGRMWDVQAGELRVQARVLVPDLPGFGRSADAAASSLDEMADDIAAMLDSAGIARATIAGLSMGGYVALAFAKRHRDRIARICLSDTRATADGDEARKGRDDNIALVDRLGSAALVERMLPKLLSAHATDAEKQFVSTVGCSQTAAAIKSALAAMRDRADSRPLLPGLDLPAAVIVGQEDALSPPAEAESMVHALPNAELTVLARAGHLANLEAPAAFNWALVRLLERPA